MRAAIYEESTGVVTRMVECPESEITEQCLDGEAYIEALDDVDDSSHYVDLSASTTVLAQRSFLDLSYRVEGLSVIFPSLPAGTEVQLTAEDTMIVDGGEATIEFDAPGTYEIHIYPPPQYRDEVLEVTVG